MLDSAHSSVGRGIAILNDFKSIEGDRDMNLKALPVGLATGDAKYICAGSVTLTQLGVVAYLYSIGNQQLMYFLWM